jgi:hypothetical protein
MIIMIISFTKRLLIKLGQRFKFVSCHTVVVSDATGVDPGTILPSTDCVRQWTSSALLCDTSTVPFCLWWILSGDNSQKN